MRVLRIATCALLSPMLLLPICLSAYAEDLTPITITPSVVEVGMNFGGADLIAEGKAPADTQVVVKVSTRPEAVKLSKKGRVMGIFWMTTERAVVENMPTFHIIYSSQPLETLLSTEEQSRIGVDTECAGIMSQAKVTSDTEERVALPADQAQAYVAGLRDMYIKNGRYVPCVSCHRAPTGTGAVPSTMGMPEQGAIRFTEGSWSLGLRLPTDTPLGEYDVTAYYVSGGKVVSSQSTGFSVEKTGVVATLGLMAAQNGPLYGAIALVVVLGVGLGIGVVFPKSKGGH